MVPLARWRIDGRASAIYGFSGGRVGSLVPYLCLQVLVAFHIAWWWSGGRASVIFMYYTHRLQLLGGRPLRVAQWRLVVDIVL